MIQFLAKIFIKDYENTKDMKVREQYGLLCGVSGIVLNVFLFIGKYVAGMLSGSIAIKADSFNNLSDAGSSMITLIGFHLAGKQADPEHPFGHGRVEYVSGVMVSVLIILMGFELARSSVTKILHPGEVERSTLTVIILVVSIAVKLYMAYYNRTIGNKIDSAAMRATATDSMSDSVATLVVLISTFITGFNVDGIAGLAVALFILYAGYGAMKDTLNPLLGQAPDSELVKEIKEIVLSHENIVGIHDMVIHDYGPGRLMVSLHAEVPGDEDIYALHGTIDHIEMELKSRLGCEVTIHMDPIAVNDTEVLEMRMRVAAIVKKIHPDITIHDFRMVTSPTHTNLIFDAVVPAQVKMSEEEAEKRIRREVEDQCEKCFVVVKIDRFYL